MATTSLCVTCDKCCFGKMCNDYLFESSVTLFMKSLQRKKVIKKNDNLYRHGEPITHLMALRSGTVKIYDAESKIVNVKIPGQIIGTEDLYANTYFYQAIAATDVQVCLLDRSRIYDLSQITEKFIKYITDILSLEIAEQQKMISILASTDTQTKVYGYLNLISERYERYGFSAQQGQLPITFKEMAVILGISTSSLNRNLSALKDKIDYC